MSNTDIWDKVFKTDPKYTKSFSRGGGFKGTAINPTYCAKKATEVFGPCGKGWGVRVLDEAIIEGHPVTNEKGDVEGHVKVHKVLIEFWYMQDDQRCTIEHFGQTEMVGVNKHGWFTDEEAPKKSITDAMTKAMSLLGFGADIHMGLYDDSKYVAELKAPLAKAAAPVDRTQVVGMWEEAIRKATSTTTLEQLKARMDKLPMDEQLRLTQLWLQRKDDLAKGP